MAQMPLQGPLLSCHQRPARPLPRTVLVLLLRPLSSLLSPCRAEELAFVQIQNLRLVVPDGRPLR